MKAQRRTFVFVVVLAFFAAPLPGRAGAASDSLPFDLVKSGKRTPAPVPNAAFVTMPNAPGTIDPGYRGEIRVILVNLGNEPYTIHAGDRIAQMIVARYEAVEWVEGELAGSRRGEGGFGSSGR